MIKGRLIVIILTTLLLTSQPIKANHLLGGEIIWECVTSGSNAGKFIFKVKIYRYCQTNTSVGFSATIVNPLYATYGGAASIL